jgi:hypothetical protein
VEEAILMLHPCLIWGNGQGRGRAGEHGAACLRGRVAEVGMRKDCVKEREEELMERETGWTGFENLLSCLVTLEFSPRSSPSFLICF